MKRTREEYECFKVQIKKEDLISCIVHYIDEEKKIFHFFRFHDAEIEWALEEWHTFVDFVNDVMGDELNEALKETNALLPSSSFRYAINYKKMEDENYDRRYRLFYYAEEVDVYDQEISRVYHWNIPLKIKNKK